MNKCFYFANRSDNWSTPNNIFNYYKDLGFKDFNPLADFYKNSLLKDFDKYFCNPPFSNIEPFVDYMISNPYDSVMLLPVRLNTNWFQKLLLHKVDIIIIGRICYSASGYAPFDSMLVYLSKNNISNRIGFIHNLKDVNYLNNIQFTIFDYIL